jgi:hypothetical protein
MQLQADKYNADDIIGVKTRVYDLGGGLVEFMVIGTAVKKIEGAKTLNENLPVQATIQDRETFVDGTDDESVTGLNQAKAASAKQLQGGPFTFIIVAIYIVFYILSIFARHHH